MKRSVQRDHFVAFRVTEMMPVLSRHLDGRLHRLRPRIREEHGIGESVLDQKIGQLLLIRNHVKVRGVPEAGRLIRECFDKFGVRVAERGYGDSRACIQIAVPRLVGKPASFAADECQRRSIVGGQHVGLHFRFPFQAASGYQREFPSVKPKRMRDRRNQDSLERHSG